MLLFQPLILDLKKEIVFAEKITIEPGCLARRVVVVLHQALGHFALEATGKSDQSLGMFRQKFLADVQLASDNRFDAFLVRRVDEMHGAKNIAVVGHGDGWHPKLFHAMDELFDVAGAVEEGVIGMEMQVDELIAHRETGADIASILAAWRG